MMLFSLSASLLILSNHRIVLRFFFFFQAEDGIRDRNVTGVQTCALPIYLLHAQGVPAAGISLVRADLADEQDRGRAAEAVLADGRVDILVNNAATVEPLGRSEERRVGKECR